MTGWNPVPFPESLALTSCSSKKNYYHAAVSMQLSFTYTYIHDYVVLKETCIQIFLSSFGLCILVSSWQQRFFFWIVFLVFVFFFEDLEGSVTETTNLNLWKMRTAKLVFSATNCRGTSPAIGTNMCLECFFSDWMEGWKGMGWMRCAVIKGFYFVGGGKLILWVYCIHLYTFKHKYFPPNPNLGMRE